MEIVEYNKGRARQSSPQKLKRCIFCDELIGANAVKCRMCGEFLNTEKAKKLLQAAERKAQGLDAEPQEDTNVLFAATPSLFGLAGAAVKTLIFIALTLFVFKYPLENIIDKIYYKAHQFPLSDGQYFAISYWRQIVALGMMIMFVLLFALKVLKLKMTHYEVNSDRIEYSRGIFDRRVDNIDMFRVVDLKLRRSILDCIFGIGKVTLFTSDKTDPQFIFEKVRNSRGLYDVIKKASLEADQSQRVVHME